VSSPGRFQRDLAALQAREHDLLVVGGGIHGAAVAWDAAQRGLSVALVEARDFGSGASWNSLKTIHGGLRHLQRADLPGLREAARERRALLHIAGGLVRPLPFLVPTYGHGLRGREALAVALRVCDALSAGRNRGLDPERHIPRGRMVSPAEVRARVPGIAAAGLSGGALWHDAQVSSSERLLVSFLRAAAGAGASLANYVDATRVVVEAGHVRGVEARDAETGAALHVRARVVVNAAGAAAGALLARAGLAAPAVPLLDALNLVVSRPVGEAAVGARVDGRFLFLVPWQGRAILGTDYGHWPSPGDEEAAVAAFLDRGRRAFPWAELRAGDVTVVHRGRVPGRSAEALVTRHRVVDHRREGGPAGLVTVWSAKFTTARAAAAEAVDLALQRLGRPPVPCRTATTPLPVVTLSGSLADRARAVVRDEAAVHLDDALRRRLDLATAGEPTAAEVEVVAAVMAAELGWSPARLQQETASAAPSLARLASGA
jgi:glycerol-3-phosphate dehydrogenase